MQLVSQIFYSFFIVITVIFIICIIIVRLQLLRVSYYFQPILRQISPTSFSAHAPPPSHLQHQQQLLLPILQLSSPSSFSFSSSSRIASVAELASRNDVTRRSTRRMLHLQRSLQRCFIILNSNHSASRHTIHPVSQN